MIRGKKDSVAIFQTCRYHFVDTLINCFHCFDCGFPNTGMTNHIRIGIIQTNKIGRLIFYFRQ